MPKVNGIHDYGIYGGVAGFRIEKVAALPAPFNATRDEARVLYLTGDKNFYVGQNGAWVVLSVGGSYTAGDAIDISTGVISVDYDDSAIGLTGVGGSLTIKSTGVTNTHLANSAKQSVLEYQIVPGWDLIQGKTVGAVQALDVTTEVDAAATTDTPTTSETTLGVFVGHTSYSTLPIRESLSEDPIYVGSEKVYGRLSHKVYDSGLTNITGVTITFTGPGTTTGSGLVFTASGQTLAWNGGTAVAVGAGGYFSLYGAAGAGNFIVVNVVPASLPVGDQTDTIVITTGTNKYLGFFTASANLDNPYAFTGSTDIDLLFIENFNLYTRPASAVLNGVAFGTLGDTYAPHNHDDRYYTKTEIGSVIATTGASLVGMSHSGWTWITHGDVQQSMGDIESALGNRTRKYQNTYTTQASWAVNHALNTAHVIVQAFDASGYVIIPDEIQQTDANNVVITFSSAQTGKAVVIG